MNKRTNNDPLRLWHKAYEHAWTREQIMIWRRPQGNTKGQIIGKEHYWIMIILTHHGGDGFFASKFDLAWWQYDDDDSSGSLWGSQLLVWQFYHWDDTSSITALSGLVMCLAYYLQLFGCSSSSLTPAGNQPAQQPANFSWWSKNLMIHIFCYSC